MYGIEMPAGIFRDSRIGRIERNLGFWGFEIAGLNAKSSWNSRVLPLEERIFEG
jgi:hypothetical protein